MSELIQLQKQTAVPILIGNKTVELESQVLSVKSPFGGLVWQRPTAVHITENGQTHTLPIEDPTRKAVWMFMGVGLLFGLMAWLKK